jgi:hypothetical protein
MMFQSQRLSVISCDVSYSARFCVACTFNFTTARLDARALCSAAKNLLSCVDGNDDTCNDKCNGGECKGSSYGCSLPPIPAELNVSKGGLYVALNR